MSIIFGRGLKICNFINASLTVHTRTIHLSNVHFKNSEPRRVDIEPTTETNEKDGTVRHIIMKNNKTRNALSIQMMENLINSIEIEQDNPHLRCIVISAQGKVFSAGHDLKELSIEKGRQNHEIVFKTCTKLMKTIIDCPVPIIAKVDGIAAAAGCQLVAACDLAIASESSQFITPGANFGIFCSTPGIALARCVPKKTAMHMVLTGLPLTASEALKVGLINSVATSDNLDKELKIIINAISNKSREVIAFGKKFFYRQIEMGTLDAYTYGETAMVDNVNMIDGQEGIKSFVEKRKPIWKSLRKIGIEIPPNLDKY